MNITEIEELLISKKSKDRRRAARLIGKERISSLGEKLHEAYQKEKKDNRTWETQFYMIESLGVIGYTKCLTDIEPIVKENIAHDSVTHGAFTCYIRLKRKSLSDAEPVIALLQEANYSGIAGSLDALGWDRMTPPDHQIIELIKLSWDVHVGIEKGFLDPRCGIAAASAGWNPELTREFLEHCLNTGDDKTRYFAEHSLKGKYKRLS